jgi:hypothetical protein
MTATKATRRNNGQIDGDAEERAAIMEFDGGLPRAEAEHRAGLRAVGAQPKSAAPPALSYRRITSAELDAATYDLEYLIDGLLVAGQPCILAGNKKTLKTSLLIDLGISLAMGGRFLGRLKVNRACRVGIMTGESGLATIQETARRICAAAGYRLGDIGNLVWSDQLPQFGELAHLDALRRWMTDDELEVLCVDPAYLCIPEADHGNLFDIGARLRGVSEVCQEAGAMLILCHHNRKTGKADPYSAPELEDIAWAGFQEFARQWILVGRREPYQPGTGDHRLWLSGGGSAGHSDLWAVNIAEGKRTDPGGRKWDVEILSVSEARREAAGAAEDRKATGAETKAQARIDADKKRIVNALAKLPDGETAKAIRERVGLSGARFNPALAVLIDDGDVVPAEIAKGNHTTAYPGYKLKGET